MSPYFTYIFKLNVALFITALVFTLTVTFLGCDKLRIFYSLVFVLIELS